MTALVVAFAVVVLAAALGSWLSWTATRLDALHHRVELARESCHRRLLERSGWTLELATSGRLDDAEALLLADAASRARAAGEEDFESAESDLSRTLRAVFDNPDRAAEPDRPDSPGAESRGSHDSSDLRELVAACRRVELARRFHNDLVVSARRLRGRRRTRWFRLAGHAGPLHTVDLDDAAPAAFSPR